MTLQSMYADDLAATFDGSSVKRELLMNETGDHRVTDAIMAKDQAAKDELRRMRLAQQMRQAPAMTMGTWATTIDGTKMSAARVTGDMSF